MQASFLPRGVVTLSSAARACAVGFLKDAFDVLYEEGGKMMSELNTHASADVCSDCIMDKPMACT